MPALPVALRLALLISSPPAVKPAPVPVPNCNEAEPIPKVIVSVSPPAVAVIVPPSPDWAAPTLISIVAMPWVFVMT